jgi:protein arginine kinase
MLDRGPDIDVVLSSRARLARNLVGYRFPHRASDPEREEIARIVEDALRGDRQSEWRFVEPGRPGGDARALLCTAMVGPAFGRRSGQRLAASADGRDFVLLNEEDHIRVQHIEPGLAVDSCVAGAGAVAERLADRLDIAAHPRFGFLAASPANTGIGLRVSAMVHVPGLAVQDRLDRLFRAAERLALTARGVFGEGTCGLGHVYQISNQGADLAYPERVEAAVGGAAAEVVTAEREARSTVAASDAGRMSAAASAGLRLLRPSEWVGADLRTLMRAWSDVRFGLAMGAEVPFTFAELTAVLAEWGWRFGTRQAGPVLNRVKRPAPGDRSLRQGGGRNS